MRAFHRVSREDFLFFLEAVVLLSVAAEVFYQSLLAVPLLLPLAVPICRRAKARKKERLRREITQQFKEMLESLTTGIRAGYSAENAFRESASDMKYLFGERSIISRQMQIIVMGLDNHVPLEQLLNDFAARCGVEEISEFAEIFQVARKSGGSLSEILVRTSGVLQSRIDVENEIGVMMRARRMEQTIMDAVPFLIMLYIGITSKGFFAVLYHNAAGIIVMSICLLVYLFAFFLSERIVHIEV